MSIAGNLAEVQARIAAAAGRAGRSPTDITLVGVSKQNPVPAMLAAYRAGLRHFGENRVEELSLKYPQLMAEIDPTSPPMWHLIGHLQSRKVTAALQYAHMIHSVDTIALAERLDRLAERAGRPVMLLLLECNVSGEASKAGFPVARWEEEPAVLEAFLTNVAGLAHLTHIQVVGLMTMAPLVEMPAEARPYFRSLRRLKERCAGRLPQWSWPHLSMGMTDDFEVAIEEGATLIRVGRAIFQTHSTADF